MATQESNGVANGQTSQVKIHLTSRDENIQLPQDTGAILVATGEYLKIYASHGAGLFHLLCLYSATSTLSY
jgi:hypothetical protein